MCHSVFEDAIADKVMPSIQSIKDGYKTDLAINVFDKVIELNPNNADAWNDKGETLVTSGEYDEAIKALDKAIEIDPNKAGAWNNKGIALKSLGRDTEAQVAFAKATELGYAGPT
jgi:Flp pilus assembly protein TadD